MWALLNKTAYAAERNWVRDKEGVHWWVVAVRATFDLAVDGRLTLCDEQIPPVLAPEFRGDPSSSSLLVDSDLLGLKPSTDVLLVANAHAPKGKPAGTVPVVLRVGGLEKQLLVHGDRVYYDGATGLRTTSPAPFITQAIQYESAFGGGDTSDPDPSRHRIDERNPVGRGFGRAASWVNKPAHTIEYATGDASTRGPAGFGPIDPAWLPRRTLAGTYDAKWVETKKPLLPDDYSPTFMQSAPADQRPAVPLVGGERVGLLNMTPSGSVVFELPMINLSFVSRFGSYWSQHDSPVLSTLLLEPSNGKVSMVWQSGLRVPAAEGDFLDVTEIEERGPK